MESWIVSGVDKAVAAYEFGTTFKRNVILKYQNIMLVAIVLGRML